jgi:hypothetical protein
MKQLRDLKSHLLSDKLSRYGFDRNELNETDLPLLMGNMEMGGLLDRDGIGFSSLWFSDLWHTSEIRVPLRGFRLECTDLPDTPPQTYRQTLDISTGTARTLVHGEGGVCYESEAIFSAAERRILAMQVKCNSDSQWRLHLPVIGHNSIPEVTLFQPDPYTVYACSREDSFTRFVYIFRSSHPLTRCGPHVFDMSMTEQAPLTVLFSMHTHWSGEDFSSRCEDSIAASQHFEHLSRANVCAWQRLWDQTAAIEIPDEELEALIYRSVFWTFCTCGSDKFLPGESQFAHECWHMIPFSYGAAGWSAFAYATFGHEALAHKMAREHFKSSALRHNAVKFVEYINSGDTHAFFDPPSSSDEQTSSIPDRHFRHLWKGEGTDGSRLDGEAPLSFAHQICVHGNCRIRRGNQRCIDGFIAAMFHRLASYFEDPVFLYQCAYPVLKGTAEFWRAIAVWDDALEAYTLPLLHSVSENLTERSILDATLAARGTLEMAARYAVRLGWDGQLAEQWRDISEKLYLPQNDKQYLEFLGDTQERQGGDYFGIRGPITLGFPWPEMMSTLDPQRARATLHDGWERNGRGAKMIGFIANWYSLTFAAFGDGDAALESLRHNLACLDRSGTTLNENPRIEKPYFCTNYTSFILAAAAMLVQSYDDVIRLFPALPTQWKDIAFYGIRAEKGISVSASMKNGRIEWISFSRNGSELLRATEGSVFRIVEEGDAVVVKPA